MIDLSKVRAIDVHVHADVSCHDPEDPVMGGSSMRRRLFQGAARAPRIPEIIDLYRGQQIAFLPVHRRLREQLGAEARQQLRNRRLRPQERRHRHSFRFDRSAQGQDGCARGARPSSRITAYGASSSTASCRTSILPIASPTRSRGNRRAQAAAIFHTGHFGMGTGLPGGGGARLKWGQPMLIERRRGRLS